MGCLLACFGGAKDRKRRRRPANKTLPSDCVKVHESFKPLQPSPPSKQVAADVPDGSIAELRENPELENLSLIRKKVTFNLDVKTYEEAPDPSEEGDEDKEATKVEGVEPANDDGKSTPSSEAYPLNHRYQNCASSDDEDTTCGDEEEEEYEDSDFDDEDDDDVGFEGNEEESYDSYFSLPMEKERQGFQEVTSPKPFRASSPDREPTLLPRGSARDRSQYVHSVLNPVANISQWKEVKDRAAPSRRTMKENINSNLEMKKTTFSPEPTFKFVKPEKPIDLNPSSNYCTKQEIAVEASLSNWLVSPVSSATEGPQGSNSFQSNSSLNREERPILGALTVEDLKQSSVSSSPRRSPSRSPDEIPILGTVGSYWSCENKGADSASSRRSGSDSKGIPNTTSKYREDKRVNWHSTPFEVRLERAINNGVADEACPRFPPAVC